MPARWPRQHSRVACPWADPKKRACPPERLQRIHESIQRHIDAKEISGAVTLVARRGKIAHFEAQGLMDLEAKKPMTKDAIFRLASMSKPVTAVAVMMLVEEGKIRLTGTVAQYIPEFKDAKVAVAIAGRGMGGGFMPGAGGRGAAPAYYTIPADRLITIKDLLTHTSGLGSGGPAAQDESKIAPRDPGASLATFIPRLGALPLAFQPGTQWAYSGLDGPDTLGRICEIVSGMPFDQYLRTRLFEPLGMKDTFFYPDEARASRVPVLYDRGMQKRADNQLPLGSKTLFSGGGGLMGTAEDYLQFAQMLLNGGELNGKRYLSPTTVELMSANHVGEMFNGKTGRPSKGMGFGFLVNVVVDSVASGLRVSTGSWGWDGVYGTQVWIDPKEKMVTLIMLQQQVGQVQQDFNNAVMQSIVN